MLNSMPHHQPTDHDLDQALAELLRAVTTSIRTLGRAGALDALDAATQTITNRTANALITSALGGTA